MEKPGRTLSFRAILIGVACMFPMGVWITYHETLAPEATNQLAENSPPAAAAVVFLGVVILCGVLTLLQRSLRLKKGELILIYSMLIIAAPLMSQGMWHRFVGLTVSIPRERHNMHLVDSYSEKLWPHGHHLIADRQFKDGIPDDHATATPPDRVQLVAVPESQVGTVNGIELKNPDEERAGEDLESTEFALRVDRNAGGTEVLVPGERYYLTSLFNLSEFRSQSTLSVEVVSGEGIRVPVITLRRDTNEAYSRPGGFLRDGDPYVNLPRQLGDHINIVYTLHGPGRAVITDINFFSNEALARIHKGSSEISQSDYAKLPDSNRDSLLVHPDDLTSPGGIWYVLKGYIPWSQWATPLLYWGAIVLAMFMCLLGVGVIFRRQWAENERFPFPLVVFPRLVLEEKEENGKIFRPLFRNRFFRIGVLIAFIYSLLLGLAYYVPGMPNPRIDVDLASYFNNPSMKAFMRSTFNSNRFQVYLTLTAIAFFIELDMLLSILLFMWVCKIPSYFGEAFGWKNIKGPQDNFPFAHEQHIGAFLALALIVLWTSRRHLAGVFRRVAGLPGGVDDSREAFSYRTAVVMIVVSLAAIAVWGEMSQLGWIPALTFFGFLIVCGFSAARIRTECGAPHTYFTPYFPMLIFLLMGGLHVFSTETMLLTFAAGGFMAVAQFLMFAPSQVEMLHLADTEDASPRGISIGLVVGVLAGVLIGGYVFLVWCYGVGGDNIPYIKGWSIGQDWYFTTLRNAVTAMDTESIQMAATGEAAVVEPEWPAISAVGIGSFVTILLVVLRTIFPGFWLHPIGYVLANTFFVQMVWGSLLVAWIIKWLVLKIGGPRVVRDQMRPLFAGVFAGALVGIVFWDVVSLIRLSMGYRQIFTCWP